jgi:hypothetical protein
MAHATGELQRDVEGGRGSEGGVVGIGEGAGGVWSVMRRAGVYTDSARRRITARLRFAYRGQLADDRFERTLIQLPRAPTPRPTPSRIADREARNWALTAVGIWKTRTMIG